MSGVRKHAGNPLGDLRAELDHAMLDKAFFQTPDYLSLIESSDKTVVVGRRGTGKSALAYQLFKYWHGVDNTRVVQIALEEDQVIGLKPLVELFGKTYRLVRAGCKLAWRYCLFMEIALQLSAYYKFVKADEKGFLARHLKRWRESGSQPSGRLRRVLQAVLAKEDQPENRIANLGDGLELHDVELALVNELKALGFNCVVLIDRLDDGYEPDETGLGLVDGIVSATIDVKAILPQMRTVLFLRDNIFRAMARMSPDYSRNIEGQVIRLHWNEYQLLNMVCNRLRAAFGLTEEKPVAVWNRCTGPDLKGQEGFKKCLQLTLFRPRDILVLLNQAFYEAAMEDREQVVLKDVEAGAKIVSTDRLTDLHKEYSSIFPGLAHLVGVFANRAPELTLLEAEQILVPIMASPAYTIRAQQELAVLEQPRDVLRALYGVGFIGIRDAKSGIYVFCHDGRSADREFRDDDVLLVHPCYWMSLNLSRSAFDSSQAEEIHDEYDIAVTEPNLELRQKKLNQIVIALGQIPLGAADQTAFEEWCHKAISTAFAGALRNIEFAGSRSPSRRNVVALNLSKTDQWARVYEDYGARQVVFFVENAQDISRDRFKEAVTDLSDVNGKIVFLVTRDDSTEMHKDGDLAWVRAIYETSGILVVKLTGKFFAGILGRLRNPPRHDVAEEAIGGTLDSYTRLYVKGAKRVKQTAAEGAGRAESVLIGVPANECYGELDVEGTGSLWLRIFHRKEGPGKRAELGAVALRDQGYTILEAGIGHARQRYIEDMVASARGDGRVTSASECEPPPEKTFEIEWSQDDLAAILCNKEQYGELNRKKKELIKTAMSRLRNLVTFAADKGGLVSQADDRGVRRSAIPMRFRKSG